MALPGVVLEVPSVDDDPETELGAGEPVGLSELADLNIWVYG